MRVCVRVDEGIRINGESRKADVLNAYLSLFSPEPRHTDSLRPVSCKILELQNYSRTGFLCISTPRYIEPARCFLGLNWLGIWVRYVQFWLG